MAATVLEVAGLDPLLVASAAAELAELRKLRAVARAAEVGRTQRDIADRLGVSQPAVHKMLVKARCTPGLLEQTPWEQVLRYAAGELSHDELIETLVGWPWTTDRFADADSPVPEAFVRGDWNDLSRAVRAGYLSEDDYRVVFDKTA